MPLSASPERNTFRRNKYLERQAEKNTVDETETNLMLEMYTRFDKQKLEREADPEWQKDNMEYDLRSTDWILAKVRSSESYAQNLYAAMCNNDFIKNDVWPRLKEEYWSCSWRYAGGIIADMRGAGDYIDWYCSGYSDSPGFVKECEVTDEIRDDLLKLGWIVRIYES